MEQIMLPKYYILKQKLIEKIDQEEFKANELIPSERELIQKVREKVVEFISTCLIEEMIVGLDGKKVQVAVKL